MLALLKNWINRYFSNPQVVILALLLLLGFGLIFTLGGMLTPVFISIIIAYLLEGMVTGLQRVKFPRWAAVMAVFTLFMACLIILIIWLLPLLSRQIGQLFQDLPSMIAQGQKQLMLLPDKYPEFISREQIRQIIDYTTAELTRLGQYILSVSLASVRGIITFLVYSILVPLLVFFFLKDKEMILKWFADLLPEDHKLASDVWWEVNQQIANYVRGKMWEILIVWAASYITFVLLGLPFAMLLSLFVGLSVIIQYIGAAVTFFPVGLIAFFEWGWQGPFFYVMIALAVIHALDGNLLLPLLLGEVVNIHPIAIIVSVLIFGGLWGFWGLFFAIPLATMFHAVVKAWMKNSQPVDAGTSCSPVSRHEEMP